MPSTTTSWITWLDWFPKRPHRTAVNNRLNLIAWHFESLLDELCVVLRESSEVLTDMVLRDSLPIILSSQSDSAKAALSLADAGYCATKKLYYHGVLRASDRLGRLPVARHIQFTGASANDLTALR